MNSLGGTVALTHINGCFDKPQCNSGKPASTALPFCVVSTSNIELVLNTPVPDGIRHETTLGILVRMRAAMDDVDLVKQIGVVDKRAMHDLYLRYNDAIYAFAFSRSGNAELASDCVHDTMLDVWRSAAKFAGKSSVKTWLFSIARNKLVDAMRKRGKLDYVEDVPEVEETAPNPEAAAIASAESARLHHCLEGLSGPQKAAIRLAFLEELSYPEVAEIEAVPVGTIKTRIHHAKQALMRCLERGLRG